MTAPAAEASGPAAPHRGRARGATAYATFWRWHFWAALFVSPVFVFASLTGGLYVWADEWEWHVNDELHRAEVVTPGVVSLQEQFDTVRAAFPDRSHWLIRLPWREGATTVIFSHRRPPHDFSLYAYVNPHTGELQGWRNHEASFMPMVRGLHRRLLLGTPGRVAVELATSWGVVLVLTGLYLWWPRRSRGGGRGKNPGRVWGGWLPRMGRGVPRYLFWRDLHTVPSMYASLIALVLLVTGLCYTLAAGSALKGSMLAAGVTSPRTVGWPASSDPAAPSAPLDAIVASVRERAPAGELFVVTPPSPGQSYLVETGSKDRPSGKAYFWVDPPTGAVLQSLAYAEMDAAVRAYLWAYPLHVGSVLGTPTKVIAFLTCVVLVAGSVLGVVMWWVRRPKGRAGVAPYPNRYGRYPRWLWAAIAVAGVLMPAFGVSFVAVTVAERVTTWMKRRSLPATAV